MTKLPWKQFDDVAAKEQICIVNYPDDVIPPGPNFDVKKLSSTELQLLVGPYIAAVQAEKDITGTTFRVKKWSQGMSLEPHTTSPFSHFYAADIDMPDSNPRKGLIPLITSTYGVPLRILRDSKYWRQSISKLASTTTSLHTSAPQIRPNTPRSRSVTMAPSQMATVAEEDSMADESQFLLEDACPAYGHAPSAPAQRPPSS